MYTFTKVLFYRKHIRWMWAYRLFVSTFYFKMMNLVKEEIQRLYGKQYQCSHEMGSLVTMQTCKLVSRIQSYSFTQHFKYETESISSIGRTKHQSVRLMVSSQPNYDFEGSTSISVLNFKTLCPSLFESYFDT